jgi:predicted molibdopterin-dependent oxidoreductase YjgC
VSAVTNGSRRTVSLAIDGREVTVPEGATILSACRKAGIETPTLCFLETLTPVNTCRVCVVELEGARALVPACSRPAETGMVVSTDSERVRHSRKMVLEFLASSVDMSLASAEIRGWMETYGSDPARHGATAETVAQPPKVQDELYVRDYEKCIL